ncbi:MAG: IPTL-CTERM sorting domain-containing protein [Deltaproteobacteria bacterium]|nr:IPTL-CTERM sorting domain-containing protein [Deltaproteobacteria bacterium]
MKTEDGGRSKYVSVQGLHDQSGHERPHFFLTSRRSNPRLLIVFLNIKNWDVWFMKKRSPMLYVFVAIITAMMFFPNGLYAEPIPVEPLGNPRQVETLSHLYWITQNPASWSDSFQILADIDASDTENWGLLLPSGNHTGWPPIGNETVPFTGTFDGRGHGITGIFIDRFYLGVLDFGFFGFLDNASISNLKLFGVTIRGINGVGGLTGIAINGSEIENCHVSGTVFGAYFIGGLIGYLDESEVKESSSSAACTALMVGAGGLLGASSSSLLQNCVAEGPVEALFYAGGLIGIQEEGCSVERCCAFGSVNGLYGVGGLCGGMGFGRIVDSYAQGSATGEEAVGGLIGIIGQQCEITRCYASGYLGDCGNAAIDVGGLIGADDDPGSVITSSYWDIISSGMTVSAGGQGLPTERMQTSSSYVGWDFTQTWAICDGHGYPFLPGVTPDPGPCPIPALSEWGMLILASVLIFLLMRGRRGWQR